MPLPLRFWTAFSFLAWCAAAPASVVINEIHYDEDDKTVHSEFIELHNAGAEPAALGGWYLEDAVSFVFPAGTQIAPGGYLVICEDPATMQSKWGLPSASVLTWNQGAAPPRYGQLKNGGDTVTLRTAAGERVSEVAYQRGFPWPTVGDPPNYSIELIHPSLDHTLGGNWRASDGQAAAMDPVIFVPEGSAAWKYRKALSEPSSPAAAWRAASFAADDGSWLASAGGAPFGYGETVDTTLDDMRSPPATPGYTGLYMRHTFTYSGSAPGPLRLKVWSDDGFIAWINGVEVARFGPAEGVFVPYTGVAGRSREGATQPPEEIVITAPNAILTAGENVLCIHALNESLSQSSDFYIDAELGFSSSSVGAGPTPGKINSVHSPNAPPAVRQVAHIQPGSPAPPWAQPGMETIVTAKITDPQGVSSATLRYQIVEPGDYVAIDDPRYEEAASWASVPMNDDGLAGDATAGDAIFSAVIPASSHTHRRLIRYRIAVSDGSSLTAHAPRSDDPQPNFAYFVYGSMPAYTAKATPTATAVAYSPDILSTLPAYHLITTTVQHANAQQVPIIKADGSTQAPAGGQYGHSLYNWKGALCYNGRVYDHIRFRARGGVWRFAMGKNMWKFDFNKGHDFEALDNRGVPYSQGWKKLNFSSVIQQGDFNHRGEQGLFESVGFRLFQLTGLPAENTHFVHFRIVSRPNELGQPGNQFDDDFQGLYLAIEQLDGQFLDEHGLPDGNLYKMEGGTGDLNNQGRTLPKNKSDLTAFQRYTATEAWWRQHADLPQYYNYRFVLDAIHHYDIGDGKNYFYFHNPETQKWNQLAWDLDLTWSDNMYGGGSGIDGLGDGGHTEPFFSRVYGSSATSGGIAPLKMELRNRARELLDLLFTPEQAGMLIDEMASFVWQPGQPSFVDADRAMWDYNPILNSSYVNPSKAGHGRFYQSAVNNPATPENETRTFIGMAQKMKNYVAARRTVIRNQLITVAEENLAPATPTVSRTGEGPLPTNAMTFASSAFAGQNGASFAAMKWRIAEVTDPAAPGFNPYDRATPRAYEAVATWESEELAAFAGSITIPAIGARPGGTYRVRVKHKDSAGRWSHWSEPVQFQAAQPDLTAYHQSLVVSQIMYNPAPPSPEESAAAHDAGEYEWLELMNAGTAPLDMAPIRLTKGVDFDFASSPVTSLAPGQRVVIVKNLAAFQARYGAAFPGVLIAGQWETGDSLNNSGEQLKVSYGAGTGIRDFIYSDKEPWPTAADGAGYALVLADPSSVPDHNVGQNWRASTARHGAPGQADQTPGLTYAAWAQAFSGAAPDVDSDLDGFANVLEYALGTSPADPASTPVLPAALVQAGETSALDFQIRIRTGTQDAQVTPEISSDLDAWASGDTAWSLLSTETHGDGTATLSYRAAPPPAGAAQQFIRVRVSLAR